MRFIQCTSDGTLVRQLAPALQPCEVYYSCCHAEDKCKADWITLAKAAMVLGQGIKKHFPEVSSSNKKANPAVISDVGRLCRESYALRFRMICSYSDVLRVLTLQAASDTSTTQKVLLTGEVLHACSLHVTRLLTA